MNSLENLTIEGTQSSPKVFFQVDGHLNLSGRSMPDNPAKAFEPMFLWIEQLDSTKVIFDIQLDYLNTSSSLQLFNLLRTLDENNSIEEFIVNWHYESDDEDHFETGQFFEEKLQRTKFNYVVAV